jgi:photosystem II stability/assembly factor-like uncharacterized protein
MNLRMVTVESETNQAKLRGAAKCLLFFLMPLFIILSCCQDETLPVARIVVSNINSGYTGLLSDIYFKNEQIGFIVGDYDQNKKKSYLLKTLDGGNSWVIDTFRITSVRINALTGFGNKIYALGTSQQLNNNDPDHVYVSEDDGTNWFRFTTNYGYPYFIDDQNSLLVECGNIYITNDGGNNWVEVFQLNAMACIGGFQIKENNTVYFSGGAAFDGANFGFFYKSMDGGLTWKLNPKQFKSIISMHFLNSNVGYVFEDLHEGNLTTSFKEGTAIYKTTDGGSTWIKRNTEISYSFNTSPHQCHFTSESEGVYNSINSIYFTEDGGETWHLQYSKNNTQINRLYFVNNSFGFAIGANGLIWRLNVK